MLDIDTNESMLTFAYNAQQSWKLPSDCQPVSYAQIRSPRFSRKWWPAHESLEQAYEFYRCKGDVESELGVTFFFPLERHTSFAFEAAKTDLALAYLVIADLSLELPSCYFELGLAEAVGAPVVVIVAMGTMLHQTENALPLHTYTDLDEYRNAVFQAVSSAGQSRDA